MKTPEDEAFDELARRQGMWGGGFLAKRAMAADKLQEPVTWAVQGCSKMWRGEFAEIDSKAEAKRIGGSCIAYALYTTPPQPEPEMLTIAYQSGYHDGKKAALAAREWNFCERCGKRTADKTAIHTCTPPQEAS